MPALHAMQQENCVLNLQEYTITELEIEISCNVLRGGSKSVWPDEGEELQGSFNV